MTDPDLIFDMDPQNVRGVEQWIAARWPGVAASKEADGSRLTWTLGAEGGGIDCVVATEAFLSMTPADVDRLLDEARRMCEEQPPGTPCQLLLTIDGPRIVATY
jgi:hypothetical protein